jgi:hypothetical protein
MLVFGLFALSGSRMSTSGLLFAGGLITLAMVGRDAG